MSVPIGSRTFQRTIGRVTGSERSIRRHEAVIGYLGALFAIVIIVALSVGYVAWRQTEQADCYRRAFAARAQVTTDRIAYQTLDDRIQRQQDAETLAALDQPTPELRASALRDAVARAAGQRAALAAVRDRPPPAAAQTVC
jgi:hypothetical protein